MWKFREHNDENSSRTFDRNARFLYNIVFIQKPLSRYHSFSQMKRRKLIILYIVGLTCLVLTVGYFLKDRFIYLLNLNETTLQLEAEISQISWRNKELLREIDSIKADNYFIEKVARDEFGLVRNDEITIIFD